MALLTTQIAPISKVLPVIAGSLVVSFGAWEWARKYYGHPASTSNSTWEAAEAASFSNKVRPHSLQGRAYWYRADSKAPSSRAHAASALP